MSKGLLLIASFVVMLCDGAVFAQSTERHLSIEEMFAMADQNSKTIKAQRAAVEVAHQGVREAQAGRLPDIDLSLSASYLGNGHLTETSPTGRISLCRTLVITSLWRHRNSSMAVAW